MTGVRPKIECDGILSKFMNKDKLRISFKKFLEFDWNVMAEEFQGPKDKMYVSLIHFRGEWRGWKKDVGSHRNIHFILVDFSCLSSSSRSANLYI